jgi:hypothetical protein
MELDMEDNVILYTVLKPFLPPKRISLCLSALGDLVSSTGWQCTGTGLLGHTS